MFHSCVLGWSTLLASPLPIWHRYFLDASHGSSDRENVHKSFVKIRDFFLIMTVSFEWRLHCDCLPVVLPLIKFYLIFQELLKHVVYI